MTFRVRKQVIRMLAFFIAISILGRLEVAMPAVVYGALMLLPARATIAGACALAPGSG